MKLLNHTLLYISITLLLALGIWAALFYSRMLAEVYDSLDDGLANYKILIIQRVDKDSSILKQHHFEERNYLCTSISNKEGMQFKDVYKDTLLFTQYEQDWEPYRMLTTVIPCKGRFYQFKIISPMVEEDDLVDNLTYSLWALYLVLLICILLLNKYLLKRLWKPFYYLLDQLKLYQLGGPNKPIFPPTQVDEFKALNTTVSALLDSSQHAYDNQKQFIENAAHELQTPLAIGLNRLELLAERNELSEESLVMLAKAIQSLERLSKLNKSLLLLSKIENRQFIEEEEIDFQEILFRGLEEFSDLAEYKNIRLSFSRHETFRFRMNKTLAEVLVNNLLKNAILHTSPNGDVEISMGTRHFSLSNPSSTGLGLNQEKLFARFYKESQEKTSTGLGLAIVKAISNLYHLQINYSLKGGNHSFTVYTNLEN